MQGFVRGRPFVDVALTVLVKVEHFKNSDNHITMPSGHHESLNLSRHERILDAKKYVGIKNVGNKCIPDAMNIASVEASRIHFFWQLKPRGEKKGDRSASSVAAVPPPSATLGSSSQQHATPTPRSRAQSRLLELERHVAINGCIPMTIASRAEKLISPHATDVGREYIEVVKDDLQRLFVLDFNDQAMNRKYSDLEEARANPPKALYELAERKGEPVNRVELFQETHVQVGTFVSQAAEDALNQILELQSQPIPESSQPLSEDEICDQVLGRRPGYSKGLGWGLKPKARRTASASSSSKSCL
ncbi:CACTA en-spm transposon protein [Cucumis melo var. makuwa]|uniref:CACTA en-spm transposon protein n=1 Tax=Cucumis melo var. makuwa TaxID=1194695 RepID=A0A5A7TY07_CUCMM|nr:CACTA en-spm transposon protein [Cucumis melo var. makuwa]